jgi:hypothetical protein
MNVHKNKLMNDFVFQFRCNIINKYIFFEDMIGKTYFLNVVSLSILTTRALLII